MKWNRSRN